jgi:hypothetical protein
VFLFLFISYLLFKALEEISKNYSTFSPSQKQQLKVLLEDIIVCFAHNITVKRESLSKT